MGRCWFLGKWINTSCKWAQTRYERHDVDMGNVSVPHFGVHLSRKDFDALKQRLKDNGTKYYDEPYLRFKGTKYEQETFFVKDPNENILEIKTLTANAD